jgi:N-acetylglucosaminyl-diphospho-decaprenol L-rhamnosyltransferase
MLLVAIVNYRTPQLTIDCLGSIADEVRALGAKAVVVDNASGDDSVGRLNAALRERQWGDWLSLLPLEANAGFSAGNNAAIRAALAAPGAPELILLLNPDTVVRPGAIQALVEFLQRHPQAGIVGSRLEDPDGTPQRSAFRFPSLSGEFDAAFRLGIVSKLIAGSVLAPPVSPIACQTDWVAGASMLVRREVFADVGLLDENYFLYYEEVDFCHRALRRGWQCWYEPASRVVHLVGQASGVTNSSVAPTRRRPAYWFESRRRYLLKHHSRLYVLSIDAAWVAGYAAWWLRAKLTRKPVVDPPRFWRDYLGHSAWRRGFSL